MKRRKKKGEGKQEKILSLLSYQERVIIMLYGYIWIQSSAVNFYLIIKVYI